MSARGFFGALLGATAAGLALRARKLSQERGESMAEAVTDLPGVLQHDLERVIDAARAAVTDGKRAAARREVEIEEVLARPRRTDGENEGTP